MPLQFLEVGFHVEIHAIEWHDFERDTQFHGVVVARIEFSQFFIQCYENCPSERVGIGIVLIYISYIIGPH